MWTEELASVSEIIQNMVHNTEGKLDILDFLTCVVDITQPSTGYGVATYVGSKPG